MKHDSQVWGIWSNLRLAVILFLIGATCHGQIWAVPIHLKMMFAESRLRFYGRVTDQYGAPVKDAKVKYTVSHVGLFYPKYAKHECQTDADGRFEIHGWRAAQLFLDSIECSGYSFSKNGKIQTAFEFMSDMADCFKADKSKPVEFHMRKKHPEAVYLYDNTRRGKTNNLLLIKTFL